MKTIIFIIGLAVISLPAAAQDDRYREAMEKAITLVENASGQKEFLEAAGRFERIAGAEKTRWMPYYYGAYALVVMSFEVEDGNEKDRVLDRAQALIDSAMTLCPGESEIHVLQAFLYPSRILVDPMGRGMLYMEKIYASLETARALNPENPRTYFLEGVNKLNLPPAMGGGAEVARPVLEKAALMFSQFVPEDPLWPSWGKEAPMEELKKLE